MFTPWPVLETIARYGHQGVPLFFVISGYCYRVAEKPFHTFAKAVGTSSPAPKLPAAGMQN